MRTMQQVNSNLIMMYFRIGKILYENSEYGTTTVILRVVVGLLRQALVLLAPLMLVAYTFIQATSIRSIIVFGILVAASAASSPASKIFA